MPVFADVDTGVDDAMALAYLLASDDAELVGVASTAGNVPVDQVCINNLGLLELCGAPASRCPRAPISRWLRRCAPPRTPTARRVSVTRELPTTGPALTAYDAAEAWVRAAHDRPGQLIGLVTGPLTNLALAMRAEPALPRLLRRLVIMGGAFGYRGNTTPVAEWNISVDPEAAAEVFAVWSAAWGLGRRPISDAPSDHLGAQSDRAYRDDAGHLESAGGRGEFGDDAHERAR